jgi:tetratricopeptide (TPR) repeat protein
MLRAGSHLCLAAILLLGASGVAPAQSADAAPAQASGGEVARAKQLYDDGKYKESISLLDGYLTAHPGDATALVTRGDDYQALGSQESAIADYTAALAINADYAYAWASRCDSYLSIRQSQKALADCDKAIGLDPGMGYAYRLRALLELDADDAQSALTDVNHALTIDPHSPAALTTRCHTYLVLLEYPEAIADCNAALAIDPNRDVAYFYRGETEIKLSDWDRATADFTRALALAPDEANADYWLAVANLNRGAYADALKAIDAYIQSDVDDPDGQLIRATIEVKLGNAAAARASATTALKHYMIGNDRSGAAKAQAILDSLGAPAASPPPGL